MWKFVIRKISRYVMLVQTLIKIFSSLTTSANSITTGAGSATATFTTPGNAKAGAFFATSVHIFNNGKKIKKYEFKLRIRIFY